MTSDRPLAVVTGASSGIGAASARYLAREGFEVICAARRLDRIEALAKEIDGRAVRCDVTSTEDVAALATAVGDRLAVLVNNPAALAFWTRLDYAEIDRRPDLQAGRDCVVMHRDL